MKDLYKSCRLCPRGCGVNRLAGEKGFCGETAALRIAAAVIHKGEEPPITGTGGSGAVFISGCNLGCSFCQNYQISHNDNMRRAQRNPQSAGREVSPGEFAAICAALRGKGAENINIVTGSHAVPGIIEGITAARENKVLLPVLWNSSGYDSIEALELLSGYVDIFLPDLKTLDSKIAEKYFNAPDYPDRAKAAILKMIDITRQKQHSALNQYTGVSKVIVRHLVLPGCLDSTRSVLRWFADNAKDRAMFSLMTQYTPVLNKKTETAKNFYSNEKQIPDRFLSAKEFETVLNWLDEFEIEDGFCQELITGSDWLPDFNRTNPFSSELSVPVWSWKD